MGLRRGRDQRLDGGAQHRRRPRGPGSGDARAGRSWGEALVAAVRAGEVDEAAIEEKVLRLLRLAARVGGVAGFQPATVTAIDDPIALAREIAAAGMVLLRNEGDLLPLDPSQSWRIAVIGQNADHARTQGGGSATVIPTHVVSPLAGIRGAFGSAQVDYAMGAVAQDGIIPLPLDQITNPQTGEPGMLVTFLPPTARRCSARAGSPPHLVYFGGDAPITTAARAHFEVVWTPPQDGEVLFGFACVGHGGSWPTGSYCGRTRPIRPAAISAPTSSRRRRSPRP